MALSLWITEKAQGWTREKGFNPGSTHQWIGCQRSHHFPLWAFISSSAKQSPLVSIIADLWGNKRICINAGVAGGSYNPFFCPLHSPDSSQLKAWAQFITCSMSVCYRQIPKIKTTILFFQCCIQPLLYFWWLESPHHHCRGKMNQTPLFIFCFTF